MTDARNIIFQLVNTEWNKDLISKVPHRTFMDLSIIYVYVPDGILNYKNVHIVSEAEAAENGLTEQELFVRAYENTRRILPPLITSLGKLLEDLGVVDSASTCPEVSNDVLVISNAVGFFGAASIIYEYELYEISCKFKSDLYILPSSLHECLIVPVKVFENPHELTNMVRAVNEEKVEPVDRLSNDVYRYGMDSRKIILCH